MNNRPVAATNSTKMRTLRAHWRRHSASAMSGPISTMCTGFENVATPSKVAER
jgi:hypothetical protein